MLEIKFFTRNLSHGERLGELLFGLIMTLTFTLTAGFVVGEDAAAVNELLKATIGCNIAWGIIDGGLMIVGRAFDRGRFARMGLAIRSGASDQESLAIVAEELDETLEPLAPLASRQLLYRDVIAKARANPPQRPGIRGEDWLAALVMFVMVFFASLPAALPFLFIDEPWLALRVSNAVLLVLLFVIGYHWAGYTTVNRWRAGFSMLLFGGLLVAVAIALGG
ncbi:MAG TPA: VIT1/CCC1 transporter family protein [Xanthomonadales bacterium]|nr:VIT1/CCC1 transporter family protein [Xanthomonadales bacterium]